MTLDAQFRASFVRRWHTNPDLAQTVDTLAGHGGRVARIILKLWPDSSLALLHWALVHDDGESVVGDVPAPAKGATVIHEQERAALFIKAFDKTVNTYQPVVGITVRASRAEKFC